MKVCTKCKIEKSEEEFHLVSSKSDKRRPACKACVRVWLVENKEKVSESCRHWRQRNPERVRELNRRWLKTNREYNKMKCLEWAKNNYEYKNKKCSEWYQKNKDRHSAYGKRWNVENRDKYREQRARYRAAKLRARPIFLTEEQRIALREIYANCPPGYHVDHIIPLQGKIVSGLHVPENLQYLPAVENIRKKNKFTA